LVAQEEVRSAAQALALEIAQSAPLAVLATRETVRRGLIDAVEAATERELVEQDWMRRTEDFQEGIKAMADRRLPNFQGRQGVSHPGFAGPMAITKIGHR